MVHAMLAGMETLIAEAQTYGTLFSIEFGHWIGASAVMLFVIMRSILWYAIPTAVHWKGDTLSLGMPDSIALHRCNRITNVISTVLLVSSAYLVGLQSAVVYTLVLGNMFLIIKFSEALRKDTSIKEAGFENWDAAVAAHVEQREQRKAESGEHHADMVDCSKR